MAGDAELLLIESLVFGRLAMGETAIDARLADSWRVRRDGKLVFADETRLDHAAAALDRIAVGAGARAVATIVAAAPNVEARLPDLRAALEAESEGVEAGASFFDGLDRRTPRLALARPIARSDHRVHSGARRGRAAAALAIVSRLERSNAGLSRAVGVRSAEKRRTGKPEAWSARIPCQQGKKQGISRISAEFGKNRPRKAQRFEAVPGKFPTRASREIIRRDQGTEVPCSAESRDISRLTRSLSASFRGARLHHRKRLRSRNSPRGRSPNVSEEPRRRGTCFSSAASARLRLAA